MRAEKADEGRVELDRGIAAVRALTAPTASPGPPRWKCWPSDEDIAPPPLHEGSLHVVTVVGEGDLVVGVDDDAAELAEEPGDVALARADAAEDADDGFAGEHGARAL